jgi:vacuolar-type H+-ATPase subunit H
MRKIVKEILETESKVGDILRQARQKASDMRHAAENEASKQISDARQEARGIIQNAVEDAKKEAERIREQMLSQADQQGSTLLDGKADAIEGLVDRICDIILTAECGWDDH